MAIYSHPVLRVDTDDVEGSVMFSPPTVGDNQLTLENIVIENDEINERIRDGRACYSLYIENSQSFFSRIFQFQKNKYNIFLNPKEYPQGKYSMELMVVAKKELDAYLISSAALLDVLTYFAPLEINGEYRFFKILLLLLSLVPIIILSG